MSSRKLVRVTAGWKWISVVVAVIRLVMLLLVVWPLTSEPLLASTIEQEVADHNQGLSFDEFSQQGRVSVRSWLDTDHAIVPSQLVNMKIEVSTDRWFLGGTKIRLPEIPGVVIVQREQLAVNGSRQVGRTTISTQTWNLSLFASRSGLIKLPEIPVRVTLANDQGQAITGQLMTAPLQIRVSLPAGWDASKPVVAAPLFEVVESYNRDLDQLRVGDALIRTVKFTARDSMAMLLPDWQPKGESGLSVYRAVPRLDDRMNRGQVSSSRSEQYTYMVEKEGQFVLPEQQFYWWNTRQAVFEIIRLTEQRIEVKPPAWRLIDLLLWGAGLLVGLIVVIVMYSKAPQAIETVLRRVQRRVQAKLQAITQSIIQGMRIRRDRHAMSENQLKKTFSRACRRQDTEAALVSLYRWLDHSRPRGYSGSIREWCADIAMNAQKDKSISQNIMLMEVFLRCCAIQQSHHLTVTEWRQLPTMFSALVRQAEAAQIRSIDEFSVGALQ